MPSLESVLRTYLQVDRSPVTNNNYAVCLSRLVKEIGPGRDIQLVSFADLVDYTHRLRQGISVASYAQYVRVIKAFFAWCVECRYLESSPAAGLFARKPPKNPKNRAIPPEDLQRLRQALVSHPRNYAILLFFIDTGCRVGALARLRLADLNLEDCSAVVLEKGGRLVEVYFSAITANALRDWLKKRPQGGSDRVFTRGRKAKPISAAGVRMVIKSISRAVCSKVYTPHTIRHALGHALADLGLPVTVVQQKLNHSDPKTTMEFYFPKGTERVRRISQVHPLVSLGEESSAGKPDKDKIIYLNIG